MLLLAALGCLGRLLGCFIGGGGYLAGALVAGSRFQRLRGIALLAFGSLLLLGVLFLLLGLLDDAVGEIVVAVDIDDDAL